MLLAAWGALRQGGPALGVGALCWAAPLADHLFRSGNLAEMLRFGGSDRPALGLDAVLHVSARTLAAPP